VRAPSRAHACAGGAPVPHPDQPPIDVRLEYLPRASAALAIASPPSLSGLLRYSSGAALSSVGREPDFTFAIADASAHDALAGRLAYHRADGTPCVGILVAGSAPALPGALTIPPADLARSFDALVHNLFAPFLLGLVCVDWYEVLSLLDQPGALALAWGGGEDPAALGRELGRRTGAIRAGHAVLYAPLEEMRLRDIRAYVGGLRGALGEDADFVYSAPGGSINSPWWGCIVGMR
jgi:hypothetical protein